MARLLSALGDLLPAATALLPALPAAALPHLVRLSNMAGRCIGYRGRTKGATAPCRSRASWCSFDPSLHVMPLPERQGCTRQGGEWAGGRVEFALCLLLALLPAVPPFGPRCAADAMYHHNFGNFNTWA